VAEQTHFRTCPLCEASCGLAVTTRDAEVVSVRGDPDDVFSRGYLCPKGVALADLHDDPDRLRTPMVRQPDGSFSPAGWDEAFALIEQGLAPILAADRNAVALYLGNPNVHNLSSQLYLKVLAKALGSRNAYSASSLDQVPKQASCALMFGHSLSVPIPDVDRTDHLLVLGANPLASNGSLLTAPDMPGRLRALRRRGGRLVVVDPRRSRTAEIADEHVPIRPGTDALLLLAMVHVLFAESLTDLGRLAEWTDGVDEVRALAGDFSPAAVAATCGIEADTITRLARDLAAAPRAAVYGRVGTCTQEFGTLASWLVDVLNVLTGNLDAEGGVLFPLAAAGQSNSARAGGRVRATTFGRWHSRVRGRAEVFGELPSACLAEEIDTPGPGQVRALITLSGNPVLSAPNSDRLDAALPGLDFMVSVDVYLNETTRHADVVLPAPSPLLRPHYDLTFYQLAVRNVANYSAPTFAPEVELPDEWVTMLRLAGVFGGQGAAVDAEVADDLVALDLARREAADPDSPVAGWDPAMVLLELAPRTGPERLLDLLLRVGPYGEGFGRRPDGLSLAVLEAHPHGVDLGPLRPRLPDVLRTASRRIELAPEQILADVPRLRARLAAGHDADAMVLIGRRDLRSNNSWMHNLDLLVKGGDRCTAHVHPTDAGRLGLSAGDLARVTSRTGSIEVPVEITDRIMPGVVSIPHGWGHDRRDTRLAVAQAHPGVNSNLLADDTSVDAVTGNAVLNGIPVVLAPV
jgi:anaerobic selenocysteine-containing dehydrogenase